VKKIKISRNVLAQNFSLPDYEPKEEENKIVENKTKEKRFVF